VRPNTPDVRIEHEQAQELLLQSAVQPLAPESSELLTKHLSDCGTCATEAEAMENVLKQLRTVPVFASVELVRSTQARVRARVNEMQKEQARTAPMMLACGLVVLIALISTPLAWMGFSWVGEEFNITPFMLTVSFLLFYLLPAGASIMIAAVHHRKTQEEMARR